MINMINTRYIELYKTLFYSRVFIKNNGTLFVQVVEFLTPLAEFDILVSDPDNVVVRIKGVGVFSVRWSHTLLYSPVSGFMYSPDILSPVSLANLCTKDTDGIKVLRDIIELKEKVLNWKGTEHIKLKDMPEASKTLSNDVLNAYNNLIDKYVAFLSAWEEANRDKVNEGENL